MVKGFPLSAPKIKYVPASILSFIFVKLVIFKVLFFPLITTVESR